MKRNLFLVAVFLLATYFSFGQNNITLQFNKDRHFKIAQFTDVHWDNRSSNCAKTTEVINHVLQVEKPDLVVLTGDIVTAPPAKDGWRALGKIFEKAKIPWAVVIGNHDAETDLTRQEIFDVIINLPFFVGIKGPRISGVGNYVLPIMGSKQRQSAALLYCLDSHNKPSAHKYGHYDWIHFDQIDWYRKTSEEFSKKNNNQPLPALAFFHIPLLEYNNIVGKGTTVGIKKEGVAASEINSGLFGSFIEKADVMGVFVGHDHNNDYIGIEHDIALAFGRTSGIDAYGELERGSRIINLYEGKFQFDTWIRTRKGVEFTYYFPSGLSAIDEETLAYMPAKTDIKIKTSGLQFSYYEGGRLKKIDDIFTKGKLIKEGFINNFSLLPAKSKDSFAIVFKGLIKIPERAVYRFYTYSDDGSKLSIDGKIVVDNDGSHSAQRKEGKIALEPGLHEIELVYFEDYMGEILEVGWSSRFIREEVIPDKVLFIPKN